MARHDLTLRILQTPAEMAAVEALTLAVWPGSELDVVPAHLLLTIAHNGGLVAGAFDGERLIGFVLGFLGLDGRTQPPTLKHCSHQLGVHPAYRGCGVGYALKRLQREFVRKQELELVTWTYDPLLSRNAHLNIGRLGAVCNTYLREFYGEMRDGLNAGLPSDRFEVDWWINSERVVDRMSGDDAPTSWSDFLSAGALLVNPPRQSDEPVPPASDLTADWPPGATLLLEIPVDFLALKATAPGLALAWRLGTRAAFEALFAAGWCVTDFVHETAPRPRAAYVLTRSGNDSRLEAPC